MTEPHPTDLGPEERTLAEQLARLGPRGEPSPALDARVLAAARAASDLDRQPPSRHRRWPLAVGLVASLVLAVGIAWRVRPLPPVGSPRAPAAPMSTTASAPESGGFAAPAPATGIADTAPAAETATEATASKPAAGTRKKTAASQASEPEIEFDVPTRVAAPSAPGPGPAPPPPPPRPVVQSQPPPAANAATDAARAQSDAASNESAMAAEAPPESGSTDEPLDAMPPATADAPGVREAWLLRIRTLIDSGDVAGGRRSLRAFAERYPDYPLPEDLRALLQ